MPAHSRSKSGVASLAYVAGIHVLADPDQRHGWPETSPAKTGITFGAADSPIIGAATSEAISPKPSRYHVYVLALFTNPV